MYDDKVREFVQTMGIENIGKRLVNSKEGKVRAAACLFRHILTPCRYNFMQQTTFPCCVKLWLPLPSIQRQEH